MREEEKNNYVFIIKITITYRMLYNVQHSCEAEIQYEWSNS